MDPSTLATLRRYIAEPGQEPYDDVTLNDIYIAAAGDINVAAAEVWRDKAARAAVLVDVSEGASTRKMSQVYAQASKQAEFYGGTAVPATPTTRGATTRAIER
jgi:hypothetical protein